MAYQVLNFTNMGTYVANLFANSFSQNSTTYYAFAGKHTPFANGDLVVDTPLGSESNLAFNFYQDMIFGKLLTSNDVLPATNRYDWAANTVYAMYDNNDPNLSSKQFYVGVNSGTSYDVFKCLNNNNNSPSTIQPLLSQTSNSDNFYMTGDGYQWKYMYSIPIATFNTFATPNYIPVIPNPNVQSHAVPASIDVITVTFPGNGYINYLSAQTFSSSTQIEVSGNPLVYQISDYALAVNTIYDGCYLYITTGSAKGQYSLINNSISNSTGKYVFLKSPLSILPNPGDFYDISPQVMIYGDDNSNIVNAYARALVSNGFVTGVQMIGNNAGGQNYGYAYANVFASAYVGITNATSAILYPIISPISGHGGDPVSELYSDSVIVNFSFSNTEGNTILADSSYRTVGIIKDPLFANVSFNVNTTSGFIVGEQIVQSSTNASAYIVSVNSSAMNVTNAYGIFTAGNTYIITGQSSNSTSYITGNLQITGISKGYSTFSQVWTYTGSPGPIAFTQDEEVYSGGSLSFANAYYISSNSTTLSVTNKLGEFQGSNTIFGTQSGANFNINNFDYEQKPDIVFGSGKIIYLENFNPINRSNTQNESISLVLTF